MEKIIDAQRYARRAVCCIVRADDVDDVLQDAALLAWRKRKQFRREAKYSTWFTTIAVRAALMHLQRRQAEQLPEKYDAVDERAKTPEELAAIAERDARLYAAISELSPRRKQVALEYLAGETATGTADKAARHKMREALRRRLA